MRGRVDGLEVLVDGPECLAAGPDVVDEDDGRRPADALAALEGVIAVHAVGHGRAGVGRAAARDLAETRADDPVDFLGQPLRVHGGKRVEAVALALHRGREDDGLQQASVADALADLLRLFRLGPALDHGLGRGCVAVVFGEQVVAEQARPVVGGQPAGVAAGGGPLLSGAQLSVPRVLGLERGLGERGDAGAGGDLGKAVGQGVRIEPPRLQAVADVGPGVVEAARKGDQVAVVIVCGGVGQFQIFRVENN